MLAFKPPPQPLSPNNFSRPRRAYFPNGRAIGMSLSSVRSSVCLSVCNGYIVAKLYVISLGKTFCTNKIISHLFETRACKMMQSLSHAVQGKHFQRLSTGQPCVHFITAWPQFSALYIRWYHRQPSSTNRLATIRHDWHTIVHYDPSRSSKVNDFHLI